MIIVAGLTPAWQQIMSFDRLRLGEVNRARTVEWCASGKVLNVGIALAHLGAEHQVIAPLGPPTAEAIAADLAVLGVRGVWIRTRAATRVCTTILDEADHAVTELVENQRALSADELAQFQAAFEEAAPLAKAIVLTGSLPADTPPELYCEMTRAAQDRVILDARGPELSAALPQRPWLVKPNREELARTVGRSLNTDRQVIEAMRELNAAGARWVLISQGPRDALLTSKTDGYRLTPPALEATANPIGCGDSLAAGIAWAWSEGHEPVDAVRLGMGAAADNATQLLPARLDPERVHQWADRVKMARL